MKDGRFFALAGRIIIFIADVADVSFYVCAYVWN